MAKADTCHACVYGWLEPCQLLTGFAMGFPSRPQCANQPGHYGRPTPTPVGKVCSNYRPRPPEPTGEAVRRILLTNGMVAYVDAADYEELSRYTWHFASGGYAGRYDNRTLILMHRQIMSPPEGMQVDHIRHNRLDNTRTHLRVCTASENARNRSKRGCASSRYFGVTYNKRRKKWIASLKVEGRVREVGFSYDEKEAARAHDYAAVRHFGDYVRLNFPEEWPPERRAEVRAAAAVVGANHHSPSPGTDGKEKAKGKSKKAKSKDKKPRAETRSRRAAKQRTKKR